MSSSAGSKPKYMAMAVGSSSSFSSSATELAASTLAASGSYSSEPRWVPHGVTEPAHGTHRPQSAEKSTAWVSTAVSMPSSACSTLVT